MTTHPPAVRPKGAHVAPASGHSGLAPRQHAVEADLAHGKVVALLFWDPSGAEDVAVRRELKLVLKDHFLGKAIAVEEARAGEVASFGSITRGVQVYGTPTIVIVGSHGQTSTLTGLQDAYSIKQAINEARKAASHKAA